jgi:cytochrome c553
MRTFHWALALAASLALTPAMASESGDAGHSGGMQGNAEAGKELVMKGKPDNPMVMPCQSCHGADGKGNPQAKFPRLAGQDVKYMVKQMKDFASGDRANYPTMANIAKGMSEQEMKDVGAYYAQQDVSVEGADASEEVLAMGERIANVGISEENVPACTSCHGPKGKGVPPVFPQIAGQHASYIEKQLNDWEAGNRANDPAKMMAEIAPKLSDEQAKAVAAYFSNVEAGGK